MERSGIQIPRISLRFIRATAACDTELIGGEAQVISWKDFTNFGRL
jgi:hypothetical protein